MIPRNGSQRNLKSFYNFSEVLKAKHLASGKIVALKRIFTKSEQEGFPMTSLREIKVLKNVSHPNVASLIDMAVSYKIVEDFKEVEDIFMVFPFMDHDLTGILENPSVQLTIPQIKCYMRQLLEGLAHLHSVTSETFLWFNYMFVEANYAPRLKGGQFVG